MAVGGQMKKKYIGWINWCLFLLSIVYFVFPLDLIPDLIPIVGWIDDIVFLGLSLWRLWHGYR